MEPDHEHACRKTELRPRRVWWVCCETGPRKPSFGLPRYRLIRMTNCPGRFSGMIDRPLRCHGQGTNPRRDHAEREPGLQPAATVKLKTGDRREEFRTSRRVLIGSSLAAMTAAAGLGLPLAGNADLLHSVGPGTRRCSLRANASPRTRFSRKDKGLSCWRSAAGGRDPESLLNDDTTPTTKFFIRNNGQIPETASEATPGASRSRARSTSRSL